MSFKGNLVFIQDPPFASDIYFEEYNEKTTPPIVTGFLIQQNGFYILQDDGSLIDLLA